MVNFECKESGKFYNLVDIIRLLRSGQGCPWDREQTHETIRRNFLEEAYEAVEAIDRKDPELLCEELGDVLMQVVFHAGIEEDEGRFGIDEVCDGVCRKLIERHPHVFGGTSVLGSEEVLEKWDAIKREHKGQTTYASAMDSVARSLPSLWRAEKVQKKAAKAGFDWPDVSGALDKLQEELNELRDAVKEGKNTEEELGDLLFSAVNVSRFIDSDPEQALTGACEKFIGRFRYIESAAAEQGRELGEMSLEDMDKLWNQTKQI